MAGEGLDYRKRREIAQMNPDSYKTFSGKGNANKWQRASKKNQYSEKLTGGGISAAKINFLEEFKKFSDVKGLLGDLQGMVEGGISSIGSQFASVFQDTAGNILSNPGDTVKIPPMKKGGIVTSSSGNVLTSGGKPVTWGAGPMGGSGNHPATRGITQNSFSIADSLKSVGNAFDNPTLQSAIGGATEAQEFFNSTGNVISPVVQGRNPLLDFETMNYVITLSCVPQQAYNNGTYRNSKGTVIAKTGGKGRQGTGPLSYDYYMERLTVRSTVAPTPEAYATNAYQIIFDITEPLGVDLIPALIEASQRQGYQDHLSAVYLLTINFVGNDDNGIANKIGGTTRYIPINIFKIDMDVSESGAKYNIQAAPYNYVGMLNAHDIIQEAIPHTGSDVKSLVQDFFDVLNETRTQLKNEAGVIAKPHLYEFDIGSSSADIIGSSLGFDDAGASANQAINVSPKGAGHPNVNSSRKVTAQKGTSIVEYLTHVIENSKFMLEQFGSGNESNSDIVSAIKIMPSTEIVALDNGAGGPQYKFVYALRVQQIAVESTNVGPVRTYNYIYTGENKDVLNLDLKYQFAYFQQGRYYDALQNKLKNDDKKVDPEPGAKGGRRSSKAATKIPGGSKPGRRSSKVAQSPIAPTISDTINPDAPAENREMADVFRKILEDPEADLIVVDLNILGDPYWVEQKSIKPGNKQMTSDGQTEPDGSVSPDANNIVVQVNAKYPSDLDDETGLMKLDQSAFFQGKFRVILCESNFEGGIFQQNLTMTRFREQDNDIKMTGYKDVAGEIIGGGATGNAYSGPTAFSQGKKLAGTFYDNRRPDTLNVVKKTKSAYNGINDKQRSYQTKDMSFKTFVNRLGL